MSKLKSFRKKLIPEKVQLANYVAKEKRKIMHQIIIEKIKNDVNLASEILKISEENIPKDIKEACKEKIKNSKSEGVNSFQEIQTPLSECNKPTEENFSK